MVLVQEILLLLFDELIIYLDIVYQIELFELFVELNCQGCIIVVVLYDFNQVCCYVLYLIVMCDGVIFVEGVLVYIFIECLVEEVFGLCLLIIVDLVSGMLLLVLCGIVVDVLG